MYLQILTNFDWVSVGVGFTASAMLFSVIGAARRKRLYTELNEQQQQLALLQTQYNEKQQQYAALVDEQNLLEQSYQEQRDEAQHFKTRFSEQEKQSQQYNHYWRKAEADLTSLRSEFNARDVELNSLRTVLEQKQTHFEQQLQHIKDSKEQLKKEFENLANQILEDKSQKFKTLNQESIEQLLKPVQGELKGFRDKLESIHVEDSKQREALKIELLHLQAKSQAVTEQADKLSNALQGQKKTQGNWGELMLENVLDSAGLRAGTDYEREVSFNTEDGRLRPDVVVYLPQGRHLVIDAKTSLNAYTRFVNADDDIQAQQAIKEHVEAVKARINELASKSYDRLPGLNSPEVVIMFVPIESAFVEALKYQSDIYQQAIEQNILVATPTTLLTSLNIVKQLWRFEEQTKYSKELANRAERFYSKLNGFLTSMEGVGKQLDKAKESYDKAFSQLYRGKGNLIKQASEFKELGVSVQKELPKESVERAQLELD
ncbi:MULTISPECIES: DNA recombination protein RmuC [unclassified Pseudoalteromonas]|uniref:DNA recombination protein RmuC n=1 Tax=unclassified Pseudoalteromonas TaxID=194690 RepID=UPI0025B4F17B|nr:MULTISPECIES: DNA recombination protein RmuC [unclassified Pseudoalteromonas]MDN3379566.1 DNA recombination protein RmuC [Pseudoalteromonas sp. APC 3893]MDN3387906.1 DNA recombination protein RmuC [Pseudoalteromonas sp. APC 4017]